MTQTTTAPGSGRWQLVHPWISLGARLILGGVLIVAGGLKVVEAPTDQVRAVRAYQLLPVGFDELVAYTLPVIEIIVGLALVVGVVTRLAAVLGGLLMTAFIVGVASAWARGLTIDCGCFGGGGEVAAGETAYAEEIVRDVGLVALAVWLVVFGAGRFALDKGSRTVRETRDEQEEEVVGER